MKKSMGFSIMLFMLSLAFKALSQDTSKWVRIDCGSTSFTNPGNGIHWQTDDNFINTGTNMLVSIYSWNDLDTLNTLRYFTNTKSCYILPAATSTRYFIRAVFYYGNYDGLLHPPTFKLELDGNDWATIVTSMSEIPQIYEVIYTTQSNKISVCLTQTSDEDFPIISVLEAWPLPAKMYEGMSVDGTNVAWFAEYRYCYGADDNVIGFPDDSYNRIWFKSTPKDLIPVNVPLTSLSNTSVDYPPDSVMANAVEAPNRTDSINLSFSFERANRINYIVIYFTELLQTTNETRSYYFYVNGQNVLTITPEYQVGGAAWSRGQFVGNLSIELRPTMNSLPPLINAIEVYSASDPLVTHKSENKGNKLGLIIGLAIGLPVALLLVIAIVYFAARKQAISNQQQVTAAELGSSDVANDQSKPLEEAGSVSMSTEQLPQPSQTNVQVSPMPSAPYAGNEQPVNEIQTTQPMSSTSVNANAANTTYPHEVSNMDMEELDELLQRHGSQGVSGRT